MSEVPNFEYVLSEKDRKCEVCGKPTRYIEINYEGAICSDECCRKMDISFEYALRNLE